MLSPGAAFDSLANDLSYTLSYQIAHELLGAAVDEGISSVATCAAVVVVGIVMNTLPRTLQAIREIVKRSGTAVATTGAVHDVQLSREPPSSPKGDDLSSTSRVDAALRLAVHFIAATERVVLTVLVQLVASIARAEQPLRSVRVASLIGTALFFVFLHHGRAVL
jgi:hypothetical protein